MVAHHREEKFEIKTCKIRLDPRRTDGRILHVIVLHGSKSSRILLKVYRTCPECPESEPENNIVIERILQFQRLGYLKPYTTCPRVEYCASSCRNAVVNQ